MKRMFKYAALLLTMVLLCMQVVCVQATLTEEEQEANRRKKAEQAAQTAQTAERSEDADETAEAVETEKTTEEAPLIAIDPGHQGPGQDMSGTEPIGPGSDVMKARLAVGTSGTASGLAEYELNLEVSLQLRDELEKRGYRVVMTRETQEINISNIERCEVANEAGADVLLRIHANGSDDSSVYGALAAAPSPQNPYVGGMAEKCAALSDVILDAYCEATGLYNRGLWITDEMTGMNWAQMPVTILEMGFMTNADDDLYMADEQNQKTMVEGIANGVDLYFGRVSG